MTTQNSAQGRRLSDLWLDGKEDKLHPAEWQLLNCAARGKWCVLGEERPTHAREENRIRAEVLRFILLGGDAEHPLHEVGVHLRGGAIIQDEALSLAGLRLPRSVFLHRCWFEDGIRLHDATAQTLTFQNCDLGSCYADRISLSGDFHFRCDSICRGTFRLLGATIEGTLELAGARFHEKELSVLAEGVTVGGSVNCSNGFSALGKVAFEGSQIRGQAVFGNAEIWGENGSLGLDSAEIGGSLHLSKGLLVSGKVNLSAIKIGRNLICTNATFSNKESAIHAPRAKIGGNVDLGEECRVAGPISFLGATIGGDITFAGGSFEGQPAVNLRNAVIDGMLVWRGVEYARGELNLAGASCRTLNMDWEAWQKPAQIRIDQFTYKGFSELPTGCDAEFWKNWLERQPKNHLTSKFRPNPYARLADVLETMGHEQEALSVRVAQKKRHLDFMRHHEPVSERGRLMRSLAIFWTALTGALVDYGYRPGKALLYLLGLITAGAIIYQVAANDGIMTPTHPLIYKEAGAAIPKACSRNWIYPDAAIRKACEAAIPSEYSTFSAIVYSADIALPIVDFRLESDWSPRLADWKTGTVPDATHFPPWGWGWWVRAWEWLQITLGWMLSLLFVSAVGGIIRR